MKNKIYHSGKEIDETYKKEIKGKGVKRYSFNWEENYIKWGKWLMSPKSEHYFEQPKILLRQVISNYLFAYLDKQKYYADQSLYVCTNYKDKNESLEYYTALLNSKLYGFYFRKFYSEEDDLFPKIKVNELKNLPVKKADSSFIQKLSGYSSIMDEFHGKMNNFTLNFQDHLKSKYNIQKLSRKLQNWHELDFGVFLKELEKARKKSAKENDTVYKKLSLSEEADWMQYFNEQKEKAQALKTEIDRTDKQIDQMVYELYELTEDEIAIVEEASV